MFHITSKIHSSIIIFFLLKEPLNVETRSCVEDMKWKKPFVMTNISSRGDDLKCEFTAVLELCQVVLTAR